MEINKFIKITIPLVGIDQSNIAGFIHRKHGTPIDEITADDIIIEAEKACFDAIDNLCEGE